MTTITIDRAVVEQALEALENTSPLGFNMESDKKFFAARTALRAALAQQDEPVQEPVPQQWIEAVQVVLSQVDALPHDMRRYVTGAGMLRALVDGEEPVQEPVAFNTCPTCQSLARAVMLDQTGKA